MGSRASANRGERVLENGRRESDSQIRSSSVPPGQAPPAQNIGLPSQNQEQPEARGANPNTGQPNPETLPNNTQMVPLNQEGTQMEGRNKRQEAVPPIARKSIREEDEENLLMEAQEAVDVFQVTNGIFRTLATFATPVEELRQSVHGENKDNYKAPTIKTINFDLSSLEVFEESLDYQTTESTELIPIKTEEELPDEWQVNHLILGKYQVLQELHYSPKKEEEEVNSHKCRSLLRTYRIFNYHILSEVIAKKLPFYEEREQGEEGVLRQNAFKMICAMWKKLSNHPAILSVLYLEKIKNSIVMFLEFVPSINLQEMMLNGFLLKRGEYRKNAFVFFRILLSVADAMQQAHLRSILHLNIKASNILVNLQKHVLEGASRKFENWDNMLAQPPDSEFLLTNFGHPITFDLKETNLEGEAFKLALEDIRAFWPAPVVEMFETFQKSKNFNERGLRIPPLMLALSPALDIHCLGLLGAFILGGGSYLLLSSRDLDLETMKRLAKGCDFFPEDFLNLACEQVILPLTTSFSPEAETRRVLFMEEVVHLIRKTIALSKKVKEFQDEESPQVTLLNFQRPEPESLEVSMAPKRKLEEFAAEGQITDGELLAYKADLTVEELIKRSKPDKKTLVGSEERQVLVSRKLEKASRRDSWLPRVVVKAAERSEIRELYEREENLRRNRKEIDEIMNSEWLFRSPSNFISEILSRRPDGSQRCAFFKRYLAWKLGRVSPRDITLRKDEHPLLVGLIYYFSQSFNHALEFFKKALPVTEDSKYFLLVDLLKKSFLEAIKPKKDTRYLMGHRATSDIFDIKASFNNLIGASVARHDRLILWNLKEGLVIAPVEDPRISAMDMDDKGTFVVCGRSFGTLFVVGIEPNRLSGGYSHKVSEFEGSHGASVCALAISAEGSICVSGALGQNHVLVWNVKRRRSFAKISLKHPVAALKVNKIGSLVAAGERYSGELKVFKFEGPDRLYELVRRLGPHASYVTHVLISVDDQVVAVGCAAKELSFWRLRDQVLLRKLRVPGLILGLSGTPMLKYVMISLPQRAVLYESFTGIFWKDFEMHGNASGSGVAIRNENYLLEFTMDGAEEPLLKYLEEFQQAHQGQSPPEEELKRFFLPDASEIFNSLSNEEEQLKFIHYVFKKRGDLAVSIRKAGQRTPRLNLYYADWREPGSMIFHKAMDIPFNGLLFTTLENEISQSFLKAEIMKVKLLRLLDTKPIQDEKIYNMVRFLECFEPSLVNHELYCRSRVVSSFNRLHSHSLIKTLGLVQKERQFFSETGLGRMLQKQRDWESKGEFGAELEGEEANDRLPFHVALSAVDCLSPEELMLLTSDKQLALLSLSDMSILFQKDLDRVQIKPFKREYYDECLWGFHQNHRVTALAYSKAVGSVFLGFETGYCALVVLETMECSRSHRGHQCQASAAAYSQRLEAFLSGGHDYDVLLWTEPNKREPLVYKG